jgi:translation initiation factor IF-1
MREPTVTVRGKVIARLRDTFFRVALNDDDDETVIARLSGKMTFARVSVVPGDAVLVELTPYDLGRGRIVYRLERMSRVMSDMDAG